MTFSNHLSNTFCEMRSASVILAPSQHWRGKEVDYRACFVFVIFKIFCSKRHRQKGFNLILCSYEIILAPSQHWRAPGAQTAQTLMGEERIFIELMTSDRKLQASREGSK
jgi:hypothetical protein